MYLDRTFNAGHFLQSQDRIHRLGLAEGTETRFTLLVSQESIDEAVDLRLRDKVEALSRLMDDPGLVAVALPQNELDGQEATDDAGAEVDRDDADVVIRHLEGAEP